MISSTSALPATVSTEYTGSAFLPAALSTFVYAASTLVLNTLKNATSVNQSLRHRHRIESSTFQPDLIK
jgi:hypothetical protein